ncbi:putative ATP-dependent RNA helicase (ISS) protein [Corchorus olitorius]|uniref:ATP-dependent RNA helicase (ISS) protein n=1 Tax=Corchorus olitorius TaxID=93759 RepID=A0A1R3KNN6_9ROSI|nr:putative ATP-dependent RNA helicase (ISS) protein [Corchorus olitorius]
MLSLPMHTCCKCDALNYACVMSAYDSQAKIAAMKYFFYPC